MKGYYPFKNQTADPFYHNKANKSRLKQMYFTRTEGDP